MKTLFDNSIVRTLLAFLIGSVLLSVVILLFPVFSLVPDSLDHSLFEIIGIFYNFDFIIPCTLLLSLFVFSLTYEVLLLGVRLFFFTKRFISPRSIN